MAAAAAALQGVPPYQVHQLLSAASALGPGGGGGGAGGWWRGGGSMAGSSAGAAASASAGGSGGASGTQGQPAPQGQKREAPQRPSFDALAGREAPQRHSFERPPRMSFERQSFDRARQRSFERRSMDLLGGGGMTQLTESELELLMGGVFRTAGDSGEDLNLLVDDDDVAAAF